MDISIGQGIAVFGTAFAAWAWVVAWGVGIVRKEVHDLREVIREQAISQVAISKQQEQHILLTERRLTMLETEFSYLRRYLSHDKPESD